MAVLSVLSLGTATVLSGALERLAHHKALFETISGLLLVSGFACAGTALPLFH